MVTHQDVFDINGEHYRVIAVYNEDKFDDYDVETYELSSMHDPTSNHLIKSERELNQFESVDKMDDAEYLIHHAEELKERAIDIRDNESNGDISSLIKDIRLLESRIKKVREHKHEIEDSLDLS